MNKDDVKKTKEELESEAKKNNAIFDECFNKMKLASVNQMGSKIAESLGFALLFYVSLILLIMLLIKYGSLALLINIIPINILPFAVFGGSLAVGGLITKCIDKKFKIEEKIKSFSKANTQIEKIEEEVKYEIETEKAKNKNEIINKTSNLVSSSEVIVSTVSSEEQDNKKKEEENKDEVQLKINNIKKTLKEKYVELEDLIKQKVLHEKFWETKSKSDRVIKTTLAGLLSGVATLMCIVIPVIAMKNFFSLNFAGMAMLYLVAPFVVGALIGSGYMIKKNKDNKKVFNKLNKIHKEEKELNKEKEEIESKIVSKTNEISILEYQLQCQKRLLESLSSNKEDDILLSKQISKDDIDIEREKEAILTLKRKL
jgi:hypothetical protein